MSVMECQFLAIGLALGYAIWLGAAGISGWVHINCASPAIEGKTPQPG